MKEYKYTINGTKYEVAVGNIEDNIVTVTVNGEAYQVELEKEPEPEKKKPVLGKPAAATQNHLHQSLLPLPQTLTRTMPSKRHYLVLSQTSR